MSFRAVVLPVALARVRWRSDAEVPSAGDVDPGRAATSSIAVARASGDSTLEQARGGSRRGPSMACDRAARASGFGATAHA